MSPIRQPERSVLIYLLDALQGSPHRAVELLEAAVGLGSSRGYRAALAELSEHSSDGRLLDTVISMRGRLAR